MLINGLYSRFGKFFLRYKLSLYADIILVLASGYLLLKKSTGWAISDWLKAHALHSTGVEVYVYTTAILLIAAIIVKSASLILDAFPHIKHKQIDADEIANCLQVANQELAQHVKQCTPVTVECVSQLKLQHNFDVNIRLIADGLASHVATALPGIKNKRKDLFISIYSLNGAKDALIYELHYDYSRDLVKSKQINLRGEDFASYECVKCMKSGNSTAYVLKKKGYAAGNSRRHRTVRHYMGCKLETNGSIFGFLNIEFHNREIFSEETEMQEFMESHIIPFKLLLEYQYLSRNLFAKFAEFGAR